MIAAFAQSPANAVAAPAGAVDADDEALARAGIPRLTKPIIYIHGFETDSAANCQQFNTMKTFFENHSPEFTSTHLTVEYYDGDTNCGYSLNGHGDHSNHYASGHRNGAHTPDTNIRHLGYHLAWFIWDKFSRDGRHVDIVAHSMGGLITRYAMAQSAHDMPGFPSNLLVDDIVTLGTPHNGPRALSSFGCATVLGSPLQCDQMDGGSAFQQWLDDHAAQPNPIPRTDWTTVGSDDDNHVASDSATGMGAGTTKVIYTDSTNIEHDDFLTETRTVNDADVLYRQPGGSWVLWEDAWWPVRWTQKSLYANGY
jgi:triacylglycerol esterase/lipase EstA (alpha/beta hydrolase family)